MRYIVFLLLISGSLLGQKNITTASDATAPLHALQPDYPTPYGAPTIENIQKTIDRVFAYLETATPDRFVDKTSGAEVKTYNANAIFSKGDFRPISYEWGVTYNSRILKNNNLYQDKVINAVQWSRQFTMDLFEAEIKEFEKSNIMLTDMMQNPDISSNSETIEVKLPFSPSIKC